MRQELLKEAIKKESLPFLCEISTEGFKPINLDENKKDEVN